MSLVPGVEPSPYAASPARRNGDLPQGLKSSPRVPNPDYPHLGFNPAPGCPEAVTGLRKKLTGCAKVLEETHGLVTKLLEGSYWEGDAAVAFREELDGGPLPLNLKNAARSVRKAARQLGGWEGELEEFQRRAGRLEEEARQARTALDAAKGHAGGARGDAGPDGERAPAHAGKAVDDAQAVLDGILGRAKKLAGEHEAAARVRAQKIRAATRKLVPHKPGFFESALDWLEDNLPDILSWTAAGLGILALFVVSGGTAAAVLLLVAAALSAGAAGARLNDPAVRASLLDGFRRGEFDADFWNNAVGLVADGLGTLPVLGAAVKGAPLLAKGVSEAGEALTAGQRLSSAGSKAFETTKSFTQLENRISAWVVTKAPRLEKAVEVTEKVAPWAGMATASYGLAGTVSDSLDNDTGSKVGTAIDGYFLGPVGVGEAVDLVQRVFRPV